MVTALELWRAEQAEWVLTLSDHAFADWLDREQVLANTEASIRRSRALLHTLGRTA